MSEKFRVAVVTVWELDAVDHIDATNKAEGAVEHAIRLANVASDGENPHVRWRRYGNLHEATLVSPPSEVNVAFANGLIRAGTTKGH